MGWPSERIGADAALNRAYVALASLRKKGLRGLLVSGEGGYGQYNNGKTQAEIQATFYDRPATAYATYQRSLCNKCHAKD